MYQSLLDTGEDFHLYVFAFDDLCKNILQNFKLDKVSVISLEDFENERLLRVKKTRTRGEYCWTCSCFSILYILQNYKVEEVTYLDSDLFFFTQPNVLLEEFHNSNKDVMITEHRYTAEYDQTATSGKYCVQFMTFKNNERGLMVLNWWCDRCEEWCYARVEDGKFGDQKYLDDWMTRFDCVYELQNIGGGVAPWNVQQYRLGLGPEVDNVNIVFYHFHNLKYFTDGYIDMSTYKLHKDVVNYIYIPYFRVLKKCITQLKNNELSKNSLGFSSKTCGWLDIIKNVKRILSRKVKGTYNVIKYNMLDV